MVELKKNKNSYKFLIIFILLFYSCETKHYTHQDIVENVKVAPKPDYWKHIVKKTEYDDTKVITMILIDELLINNDLSDKYYMNIIKNQTKNDTIIFLVIEHIGHDLLYVDKKSPSLYIKSDLIKKKFTASRTNRDDGTFIFQCFQKMDFTIEEEKIYYQIGLEDLSNIIYSNQIDIKIISNNRDFTTTIPSSTKKHLRRFYEEFLLVNKKS